MIWLPENSQYSEGGRRFTQYLLQPNDRMILLGKVGLENNTPVFEYESIKRVFAISPVDRLENHNESKPFTDSAYRFLAVFVFIVAFILITPIKIEKDTIYIGSPQFNNPLKGIESFEEFMEKIHEQPDNEQTN